MSTKAFSFTGKLTTTAAAANKQYTPAPSNIPNRKYHEQQLNPSAIYFQIQREHSFISPKNSFRRELRNSKVRVNFELKNKFQSLYCLYEPATENEFSPLPEDTDFCRNQSVISKSGRCPQLVVNNHPEKQTVFTNKESCPREGIVCSDYSNRKKSN